MNFLCNLIKKEVATAYPNIARVLRPECEVLKKCCSFGNLFEGCGKYPLPDAKRNFVFSAKLMAKNLEFAEEYQKWAADHNRNVKKTNNYFREKAGESDYE